MPTEQMLQQEQTVLHPIRDSVGLDSVGHPVLLILDGRQGRSAYPAMQQYPLALAIQACCLGRGHAGLRQKILLNEEQHLFTSGGFTCQPNRPVSGHSRHVSRGPDK